MKKWILILAGILVLAVATAAVQTRCLKSCLKADADKNVEALRAG